MNTVLEKVMLAVSLLAEDAGAIFKPDILTAISQLPAEEQARVRLAVKQSGTVQMAMYDRAVIAIDRKPTNSDLLFEETIPWTGPVNGEQLLDDIEHTLSRFVIAEKETLRAAALWSVFSYLLDAVTVAPIAHISAPEKRCGKSVLLSCLGKLAYRPLQCSGVSAAALFRAIDLWQPALLIDEVDSFLSDSEDLRGILNAGHTQDSAHIIRCVGDEHEPRKFSVWCARALCGIGKIAGTLEDRSIPLVLRRKLSGEYTENLRHSNPELWHSLRRKITRWTDDNRELIRYCRPELIQGLNDRANDCWEPLLQIADTVGGKWPVLARKAAIKLHGIQGESPSIGAELLQDIQQIFDELGSDRIFSAVLLEKLLSDDESPWATWNRGRPMTARQLAAKLSEFGIKSGAIRHGLDVKKGYYQKQFTDVFSRYLTLSVTPSQSSIDTGCSNIPNVTGSSIVTDKKTLKASHHKACNTVTDKKCIRCDDEGCSYCEVQHG